MAGGDSPRAKWPSRDADNRLEPECWPSLRPKFQFDRSAPVFTIGSCFARSIERQLHHRGFDVPAIRFVDADVTGSEQRGTEVLNRYTPPSIFQELAWTRAILDRDDTVREDDVVPHLFRLPDGLFIDLHRRTFTRGGASLAQRIEERRTLYRLFREAFASRLVILTLGLIECWWDEQQQAYVEFNPVFLRHPDRFVFRCLDYEDAFDFTQRSIDMLGRGRAPNILLTTSPIPLSRTFTDDDVIVANSYSKSVLRAVSGAIAKKNANVDYFPSFENVMLTKRADIWQNDLIHVQDSFVDRIMARVMQAYVPQESGPAPNQEQLCQEFVLLGHAGRWQEAEAIYARVGADADPGAATEFYILAALVERWRGDKEASAALTRKAVAVEPPRGRRANYLFKCARMFKAAGRVAETQECRRRAVEDCGADLKRYRKLVDSLREHLNHADADWVLQHVERDYGTDPEVALWLAGAHEKVQRPADALRVARRALTPDSTHAELQGRYALLLFRQKESAAAMPWARRAVELGSRDARLLLRMGRAFVRLGQFADGATVLAMLCDLDPPTVDALVLLARCHIETDDRREAEDVLRRCDRLQPGHAETDALRERLKGASASPGRKAVAPAATVMPATP